MYRHIKSYEIKYTDADAFDNLKLSSLLAFLEESACLSADELGFGYADVAPKNIGFIIANWYIKLFRPIKLGEELTVHTWPLKPKFLIFIRDFELYCGDEKVGVASSRWCMIDVLSYKMLPVEKFFEKGFFDGYNTERSIEFNNWKLPEIEDGEFSYTKHVRFSDYDHYFHANNTKYADYICDVFSSEETRGKFFSSCHITYVKQCKEQDNINFYRWSTNEGILIEGKVDGECRVRGMVTLDEI